jgi:3-oxoacyl-[acyl-carrier protein] reductase
MDLGLTGKNALILGAGGGLGGAMAVALAREGASVALAGRRIEPLDELARNIRPLGGRAIPVLWDMNDLDAIERVASTVENTLGQVDILINNTGGPPPGPASGQPLSEWQKQFQAMVLSVIAMTDRLLPGMKARRFGRIITSVSSGVIAPIPNLGLSNALRASLVGWSKTLAREVARDGITANVLVPGRIATDRIAFLDRKKAEREGKSVEAVEAESLAQIPAGRYGHPAEYGDMAAFLASERAGYITGSVIRVDGGYIPSI